MKVLMVEPASPLMLRRLKASESLQAAVGGDIQAVYPV